MTISDCYKILLLSVVLLGCNSPKQATTTLNSKEPTWPNSTIPNQNCEAAIDYMKKMVQTIESNVYELTVAPAARENNKISIKDLKDMQCWKAKCIEKYLNPSCLIGEKSSTVFDLFCTDESVQDYKELDQLFVQSEKKWRIHFFIANTDVGLSFVLKDGIVHRTDFHNAVKVSH